MLIIIQNDSKNKYVLVRLSLEIPPRRNIFYGPPATKHFRHCGTNMEKFASQCDLIKFPANLRNQTQITFILGIVSTVCKVSEMLLHFSLNLM